MKKRILSLLLAIVMVVGILPAAGNAQTVTTYPITAVDSEYGSVTFMQNGSIVTEGIPAQPVTIIPTPVEGYGVTDVKAFVTGNPGISTVPTNLGDGTYTFSMMGMPVTVEVTYRPKLTIELPDQEATYTGDYLPYDLSKARITCQGETVTGYHDKLKLKYFDDPDLTDDEPPYFGGEGFTDTPTDAQRSVIRVKAYFEGDNTYAASVSIDKNGDADTYADYYIYPAQITIKAEDKAVAEGTALRDVVLTAKDISIDYTTQLNADRKESFEDLIENLIVNGLLQLVCEQRNDKSVITFSFAIGSQTMSYSELVSAGMMPIKPEHADLLGVYDILGNYILNFEEGEVQFGKVVSFGANGGSGEMESTVAVNGEYILPANGFTAPTGHHFKAWEVGGVEYAPGETVTVSDDTTVKALWQMNTAPEGSYSIQGGSKQENTYWFKENSDVTVKAESDYQISTAYDGTYGNELTFAPGDSKQIFLKTTFGFAGTADLTDLIRYDGTAPTAKIQVADNQWTQLAGDTTPVRYFGEVQTVAISVADADSGVAAIEYYISQNLLSAAELAALAADQWKVYAQRNLLTLTPNSENFVYVKVTDNVGNVAYISSGKIVIDQIAPAFYGIEDKGVYYGNKRFKAFDEHHYPIILLLDGVNITAETQGDDEYTVPADNKEHTLVLKDVAGNETQYTITVYKNYTVTYKADGKTLHTETVGHGKDVAAVPNPPAKTGHTVKWDRDGKNITADTTITAVYTINKYTVTYVADGKTVDTVSVEYGKDATAPAFPGKDGYPGKWDHDGKHITADTTITAVYEKIEPTTEPTTAPTTESTTAPTTEPTTASTTAPTTTPTTAPTTAPTTEATKPASTVPATGDNAPTALFAVFALVGVIGMAVLTGKKRTI